MSADPANAGKQSLQHGVFRFKQGLSVYVPRLSPKCGTAYSAQVFLNHGSWMILWFVLIYFLASIISMLLAACDIRQFSQLCRSQLKQPVRLIIEYVCLWFVPDKEVIDARTLCFRQLIWNVFEQHLFVGIENRIQFVSAKLVTLQVHVSVR